MKSILAPPEAKIGLFDLARLLISTAPKVYYEPEEKRLKDKIKYRLRGGATPGPTREWFRLLSQPNMAIIPESCPRILSKLQRPYLHRNILLSERLRVLKEHYEFVTRNFTQPAMARIYSSRGSLLTDLPMEGVVTFSLRLIYANCFEKEGELTIVLVDEATTKILYALSFSVISFRAEPKQMFIGGLQGTKQDNIRELTIEITRKMHGLRPKALLLFVAQHLASLWGMGSLRAVSNEQSIYRDFRLRKKKISADYDEFWIESGGQSGPDGLFNLPIRFEPRPMTDFKANKRPVYRKRYEMLEQIAQRSTAHSAELGSSRPSEQLQPASASTDCKTPDELESHES